MSDLDHDGQDTAAVPQELVLPPQTFTPVPTAVGPPGASEFAAIREMSRSLASSGLVPRALADRPDAVMLIVLTGRELGLPPVMALSHVHVVDGKPVLAAETMRALVLRAGHRLRIVESTSQRAVLEVQRRGEDESARFEFTLEDAQRAGIAGKQVWKSYPQAMLLARVTSAACRAYFPDVLMGASYTAEELEPAGPGQTIVGEVAPPLPAGPRVEDLDPDVVRNAILTATWQRGLHDALVELDLAGWDGERRTYRKQQLQGLHVADQNGALVPAWDLMVAVGKALPTERPTPPSAASPASDEEEGEDPGPVPVTDGQLVALNAGLTRSGCSTRDERLLWLAAFLGRGISSSRDLTKLEASQVLVHLADEQVTGTDAPAPAVDVTPGELEPDPVCPEPACPDRTSHTDHLAWLAAGGMTAWRERQAEDVQDAEQVPEPPDRSDQGVTTLTPTGAARALVQSEKARIAARAAEKAAAEEQQR